MKVEILYFAQLADFAGKSGETRRLDDASPAKLYEELKKAYHFPHKFDQLQIAINHQLSAHHHKLNDGDSIAFLPPMTGG